MTHAVPSSKGGYNQEKSEDCRLSFTLSLAAAWKRSNSMLCVGLDPDPARLPAHLVGRDDALFEFCREIVDATAATVCAFKPQIAYFSAVRAENQLEALIDHIHRAHPGIPVVLDAKRGDIGPTAGQYAREVFERYRADAVTLSPYLGFDSIEPYLAWRDRGVILLCRTSNPGGSDLQSLDTREGKLYEQVARLAAGPWNTTGQVGLVVGATFPAEMRRVRELAGDMPLLVPGIGAQGGEIEATVASGIASNGFGMMINSSRAILYAGGGEDFAAAAAKVAVRTRDAIRAATAALA